MLEKDLFKLRNNLSLIGGTFTIFLVYYFIDIIRDQYFEEEESINICFRISRWSSFRSFFVRKGKIKAHRIVSNFALRQNQKMNRVCGAIYASRRIHFWHSKSSYGWRHISSGVAKNHF